MLKKKRLLQTWQLSFTQLCRRNAVSAHGNYLLTRLPSWRPHTGVHTQATDDHVGMSPRASQGIRMSPEQGRVTG